jgi:putative tricarboxylic transport membrane protein
MRRDRVSALFWLAVAIFAAAQGFALKLGSLHQPGPGFFPFWGGVVLAVLSLVLIVKSRNARSTAPLIGAGWIRLLVVAGAILGYVVLLERVGFVAVTFVFLVVLLRLERRGWLFSAATAGAGTVASWVLFQLWLKTPLPVGPFGF